MFNDAIHAAHCCKWHGCKYGDPNCPVEKGRITQQFLCEDCTELLRDEAYYAKLIQQVNEIKAFEKTRKELYKDSIAGMNLRIPKVLARIHLCGDAMVFDINEDINFKLPTEEQRKNLKEMLCIDFELLEE